MDSGADSRKPSGSAEPVTARDLARSIGVSQSTVSRAFSPGRSISPEMRKRVFAAAEKIGYRPNAIASILSKRRSNIVGIVLPDLRNPFYPAFLEKLLVGLERIGLEGLVVNNSPGADTEEQLARLTQYNVDTVVIASAKVSAATAVAWSRNGRSALLFNRPVPDVPVASVHCNNAGGARAIADHFHALGARRVAYVAGPQNMPANMQRQHAFIARVAELGMTLAASVVGGAYRYDTGYAAALEAARARPEAIFFANDIMAIGGLDALRDEGRLRIPDDVAIAGFDDIAMANWPRYRLTTIRQPLDAMVDLAVSLLERRTDAQPLEPTLHVIDGELVVRRTTGGGQEPSG